MQTYNKCHPPETPLSNRFAPKPGETLKDFYGLMLHSSLTFSSDEGEEKEIPIERAHLIWKLANQNTNHFDILLRVDGPWLDVHISEEGRKPTMWGEFCHFLGLVEKSSLPPWWFDRLRYPD